MISSLILVEDLSIDVVYGEKDAFLSFSHKAGNVSYSFGKITPDMLEKQAQQCLDAAMELRSHK